MKMLPDDFEELADRVITGKAADDEIVAFRELLKDDAELMDEYIAQMQVHSGLVARVRFKRDAEVGDRRSAIGIQDGHENWLRFWWRAAAVAMLLLGGIAIRQSFSLTSGLRPLTSVSPVKLVSQSGVKGLDLPEALPGWVRLSSGEVAVRLGSGVELTVLGPADLEIRDCMQVRLERGKLLVNVPHWAMGFRVLTADLEVCDLGTVFGVSVGPGASPAANEKISDVFVFKGRVQVNEAREREWGAESSGGNVRICKAGEGVRLIDGERPVKITADGTEAGRLFESVRDQAAIENPAAALAAAEKIADVWVDRYMPEKSSRIAAQRLAAALALKVPFRKTAWVRPSVSRQQETSNMNTKSAAAVLTAAAVTMGAQMVGAVSETVPLFIAPQLNRGWSTVFTNEVPLKWNWNTAATHAELDIVGMNGEVTTNFTTSGSNWVWQAFASSVPAAEDVYDLTLTFYNASEAVVGVQTSRLAVLKGAFGEAAVDPGPSGRKWTRIRENSAIPYDAGWAASTDSATNSRLVIAKVGGAVRTNALASASGYFGWKIKHGDWGYGTFNLALTFPGTEGEWDATLTRPVDGTMIKMQ